MRYIDADNLPRHGNRGGVVYWRDIEAQPTVDVVEVVRCKDCKYWVKDGNESFGYAMFCEHDCSLGGQGVKKPDDFCSYGERADK